MKINVTDRRGRLKKSLQIIYIRLKYEKMWENVREDVGVFHIDGIGIRGTAMNEMHCNVSMPELSIFL
jgi:hypothetical protein